MFGILPFSRRDDNVFDVFDKFFSNTAVNLPEFRTDIRNEDDHYLLEAELPGFSKEDISLDLKEGILTVKAEHKEESEEKNENGAYVRRERRFGSVSRSFDVSGIDEEGISANYQNGVLTLRLPKVQPVLPESRRIEIQ
jgi:HSP20 family protein